MRTAKEWAQAVIRAAKTEGTDPWKVVEEIFAAGAEAQRASDASLFRTNKVVAALILSEPLVTLPKGET